MELDSSNSYYTQFCDSVRLTIENCEEVFDLFNQEQVGLSEKAISYLKVHQQSLISALTQLIDKEEDNKINYTALNKVLTFLMHIHKSMIQDLQSFHKKIKGWFNRGKNRIRIKKKFIIYVLN